MLALTRHGLNTIMAAVELPVIDVGCLLQAGPDDLKVPQCQAACKQLASSLRTTGCVVVRKATSCMGRQLERAMAIHLSLHEGCV